MRNLLKSVFKVNLWLCAGIMIVDMYSKVCDQHQTLNIVTKNM